MGWTGAVMLPEMYILINPNPFHLNISPVTTTPAYPNKFNPDGVLVPYTRKEKSTIDARFTMVKNYFETWKNIYRACCDTLYEHVNDAFKVAPPTTPPTTGWNSAITICAIFNQLTMTYGKPTCAKTMSTSWQQITHRIPLKSCSKDALTSKRSQP